MPGVIIPPSITFIIFGIVANVSIASSLSPRSFPGCSGGAVDRRQPDTVPSAGLSTEDKRTWKNAGNFVESIWGLLLPIIILGGIMTGRLSESAAIAVVYGLISRFC